jgi:glycosyltransferase involved in cell wall biosynthesis
MVTGEYPPMEGGVGAFTQELARAMVQLDHEMHIFTRGPASEAGEPGIHVTAEVGPRWGWNTIQSIRTWGYENHLDVVNVQFQTAAYDMHPAIHWLPRRLRRSHPVVVTFHDLRVPYLFPKAGPVRAWSVKKLARDASAVIATDRADERQLQAWDVQHVRWIPIGSNVRNSPPAGYDRQEWRSQLGVESGELLIAYFGFLNRSKGGLVLIEALANLVTQGFPSRLIMIGGRAGTSDPTNYTYGEEVDALISQYGLGERVHWTGFVTEEEVSAHFLASDVTALPYLDGVSLRRGTLMAALVHGRAIVTTTPQTEAQELEGVVISVPPGDASRLAEAILLTWQDTRQREWLESQALKAADLFAWDGIAKKTLTLYQELLG